MLPPCRTASVCILIREQWDCDTGCGTRLPIAVQLVPDVSGTIGSIAGTVVTSFIAFAAYSRRPMGRERYTFNLIRYDQRRSVSAWLRTVLIAVGAKSGG